MMLALTLIIVSLGWKFQDGYISTFAFVVKVNKLRVVSIISQINLKPCLIFSVVRHISVSCRCYQHVRLNKLETVSTICFFQEIIATEFMYCVPSWLRRISSSSLATTILSWSPLSMTKMMAWLSLRGGGGGGAGAQTLQPTHNPADMYLIFSLSDGNIVCFLLVVMLPEVSVSALPGHIKHCERQAARTEGGRGGGGGGSAQDEAASVI